MILTKPISERFAEGGIHLLSRNKEIRYALFLGVVITFLCACLIYVLPSYAVVILLVNAGLLLLLFYLVSVYRYQKLQSLNSYLSQVVSGNYDLKIDENTEGELSILKNNLYKVIVTLQSQKEQLEKDKNLLSEFLADISHQLKTPLTSMFVTTDLLAAEPLKDRQAQYVDTLESQLEKMSWLIANLLKISKFDADTVAFTKKECSVRKLVEAGLKPFLIPMDLKNITLKNEVGEEVLIVDQMWTVEAISNVIKNCLEHMEDGGCLTITSSHTKIYDEIHIRDTGIGIAPEDIKHIFERFYHGRHASKESVGIGLSLAMTIMKKQKGTILVESEVGKGSCFTLRFYNTII